MVKKILTTVMRANVMKTDDKGLEFVFIKTTSWIERFSFQHMAQILLNLALSCSIVILILTMLSLMLLNVPVRAVSNCARVAVLASAVLIGVRVGVGMFGVCARSILFNCNKNNNFMTEVPGPRFWILFLVLRMSSLGPLS